MKAVISTHPKQNLALIGFMGTGKSSVGRLVAEALHFTFLDTDTVIEARAGKSINNIFQQDGETAFRQWERQPNVLERDYQLKRAMGFSPETFTRINHLLRVQATSGVSN